jgi:hypothetical protein
MKFSMLSNGFSVKGDEHKLPAELEKRCMKLAVRVLELEEALETLLNASLNEYSLSKTISNAEDNASSVLNKEQL